jgi:hypothetical protein
VTVRQGRFVSSKEIICNSGSQAEITGMEKHVDLDVDLEKLFACVGM